MFRNTLSGNLLANLTKLESLQLIHRKSSVIKLHPSWVKNFRLQDPPAYFITLIENLIF